MYVVSNIAAVAVNIVGVKQCFKEGTLVACLDEDGNETQLPIESIAVGTFVLAYDETTGEKAYKPVVKLFRNETKEWYHIFVNGEEIVCTGGHPFYVANLDKFVPAKDLKVFDKLLLSNGKTVIIDSIEIESLKSPETTYNFEVADFHTYYVTDSNILVHNMCELYRGGDDMTPRANVDIKVRDGKVKPGRGISVNSDVSAVTKFGQPYKIGDLPKGLEVICTGGTHYEITPAYEMSFDEYIELLNKIDLSKL